MKYRKVAIYKHFPLTLNKTTTKRRFPDINTLSYLTPTEGNFMECDICGARATKQRVVNGVTISFCKDHSLKDICTN